jgi:hypothetical protein
MKIISRNSVFALLILTANTLFAQQKRKKYDVIVYGGTSAGVIAAFTAKQMGKSVLLVEPGIRIGGLSSGGLGYTDIGNKYAIKGLSLDFYRKVGQHYGNFEQWIFEPHVAENIFLQYLKRAKVKVLYSYRIIAAKKSKGMIRSVLLENAQHPTVKTNKVIYGKEFIDCSYEGDLMARAGVSYMVGREDNKQYNETYNGSQLREKHQFPDGIDPYTVPGEPNSGLVWGISNSALLPDGTGNKMVQSYNFRVCLSKDTTNSIPITKPDDYQPERYELLLRLMAKKPIKHIEDFMTTSSMPNRKTDINNNGPFSTDMIGMSHEYPETSYEHRQAILKAHENYTKGFFYFVGHDPRMPVEIRSEMLQYGYPKDEYLNTNHFTTQMYVREARRMIGEYVMTQANCQGKERVKDGIGMAAYTMDSHNAERIVVNGMVKNEGDVQIGGFGPYPISYRSIIPKSDECTNLFVPVCLSASHIAYGSIRMEPVFMMMGQAVAVAACLAIDHKVEVQHVDVKTLQFLLKTNPLADGSTPEILIDNDDATGIIINGNWKRAANADGCYGPSVLVNDSAKTEDYVRFTPDIVTAGGYNVYTYVNRVSGASSAITIFVNDGVKVNEVNINMKDIVVKGQTEGEWVSLGQYHFPTGKKGSVTIFAKKADGTVLADAVLFIPARK